MIIKGQFTSEWDEGAVATDCTLNTETGELFPEVVDTKDMGSLISEKFEGEDGDTYKVCPYCHGYILKGKMFDDKVGNGLHEEDVCADPHCESHEEN